MMDLEHELQQLHLADQHIARGRNLIECQMRTIHKLQRDGHDTSQAVRLLNELRASLEAMMEHRAVIQETVKLMELQGSRRMR